MNSFKFFFNIFRLQYVKNRLVLCYYSSFWWWILNDFWISFLQNLHQNRTDGWDKYYRWYPLSKMISCFKPKFTFFSLSFSLTQIGKNAIEITLLIFFSQNEMFSIKLITKKLSDGSQCVKWTWKKNCEDDKSSKFHQNCN